MHKYTNIQYSNYPHTQVRMYFGRSFDMHQRFWLHYSFILIPLLVVVFRFNNIHVKQPHVFLNKADHHFKRNSERKKKFQKLLQRLHGRKYILNRKRRPTDNMRSRQFLLVIRSYREWQSLAAIREIPFNSVKSTGTLCVFLYKLRA